MNPVKGLRSKYSQADLLFDMATVVKHMDAPGVSNLLKALKSNKNSHGIRYELSVIADLVRKNSAAGSSTEVFFISATLGKRGTKDAAQLDAIIREAGVFKILEIKSSLKALQKVKGISEWTKRVKELWTSLPAEIAERVGDIPMPPIKLVSPVDLTDGRLARLAEKIADLGIQYEKGIPFR